MSPQIDVDLHTAITIIEGLEEAKIRAASENRHGDAANYQEVSWAFADQAESIFPNFYDFTISTTKGSGHD